MNCPNCDVIVPDKAIACPACHTALQSRDADATFATVEPIARAAKAATANDVTVAVDTPKPGQRSDSDLTFPSSGTPLSLGPADIAGVDFGPRYRVERLLGRVEWVQFTWHTTGIWAAKLR